MPDCIACSNNITCTNCAAGKVLKDNICEDDNSKFMIFVIVVASVVGVVVILGIGYAIKRRISKKNIKDSLL